MLVFSSVLLALSVGLAVGVNIKNLPPSRKNKYLNSFFNTSPTEENSSNNLTISPYFDTLELRFLNRMLQNEEKVLSVLETNEILRIERLAKENQRQRRHIFLKDLNVKLKMIYNTPECIVRISTDNDRRSKFYGLHESLSKESIEALIKADRGN
jgi:hypothetical protein